MMRSFRKTCIRCVKVFDSTGELLCPGCQKPLTPRERDMVRLVGEGLSNKEIADQLGLTVGTVKEYLFDVFAKLRVDSRLRLGRWAWHNMPGDSKEVTR
jgi:DNA-binding NarL/FixJ family response regulator